MSKLHKSQPEHGYLPVCEQPNWGSLVVHWKDVTCKRCLKRRPGAGRPRTQTKLAASKKRGET